MYGEIASGWKFENGDFTWEVTVPPNTWATITFPVDGSCAIEEGGQPIEQAQGLSPDPAGAGNSFTVQPGQYRFRLPAERVRRG
jgi:hypothetical protein